MYWSYHLEIWICNALESKETYMVIMHLLFTLSPNLWNGFFFLHFSLKLFLFHSCHGHLKDKVPSWNGVGSSSHHLTRSRLYLRSLISLWMQIFAWVYVPLLYLFQFWLLAIMRNLDKLWLCWILKWSTGKISCQGEDGYEVDLPADNHEITEPH